jgi:hypothetical protein
MGEARRKRLLTTHCYLCGQLLSAKPTNRDHVPPLLIFGESIRPQLSNLLTIPTHAECNRRWQPDEEYFVQTLLPFSKGSVAGAAAVQHFRRRYSQGKAVALAHQVLNEFRQQIGGVFLPPGKLAKLIDAYRVHDVVYKIIRGLHFHHTQQILPEHVSCALTITVPGDTPDDLFLMYRNSPDWKARGRYPGAFDYSFSKFPEANDLHYWAILLWDRIIITAAFHDPHCSCEDCIFIGPKLPEPLPNTRIIKP